MDGSLPTVKARQGKGQGGCLKYPHAGCAQAFILPYSAVRSPLYAQGLAFMHLCRVRWEYASKAVSYRQGEIIHSFIARSFKYPVSISEKGSVFLSLNIFLLPTPFTSLFITVRRILTDPCLPCPIFSAFPVPLLLLLPFPSSAFSIRVALYILFCSFCDKQ